MDGGSDLDEARRTSPDASTDNLEEERDSVCESHDGSSVTGCRDRACEERLSTSIETMHEASLEYVFRKRTSVMKWTPIILKGTFVGVFW